MKFPSIRLSDSLATNLADTMYRLRYKQASQELYETGTVLMYQGYMSYLDSYKIPNLYAILMSLPDVFIRYENSFNFQEQANFSIPIIGSVKLPFRVPIPIHTGYPPAMKLTDPELLFKFKKFNEDLELLAQKHSLFRNQLTEMMTNHSTSNQALNACNGRMKELLIGALRLHFDTKMRKATDLNMQMEGENFYNIRLDRQDAQRVRRQRPQTMTQWATNYTATTFNAVTMMAETPVHRPEATAFIADNLPDEPQAVPPPQAAPRPAGQLPEGLYLPDVVVDTMP